MKAYVYKKGSIVGVQDLRRCIRMRKMLGITQEEIGAALGVNQCFISDFENGKRMDMYPDIFNYLISESKKIDLLDVEALGTILEARKHKKRKMVAIAIVKNEKEVEALFKYD